jgi:hypothetical protein
MDNQDSKSKTQTSNRRTLILILLMPVLVLIPFVTIYWLADDGYMEFETFNRGELVNPPVQIADFKLLTPIGELLDYNKPEPLWSLVVIGDRYCNADCEKLLYLTRQANTALGKKMNKLRRYYLSVDDQISPALKNMLSEKYPQLQTVLGDKASIAQQLPHVEEPNSFFLVDRGGWIMMRYQAKDLQEHTLNALGKDVLKDMNRLIK